MVPGRSPLSRQTDEWWGKRGYQEHLQSSNFWGQSKSLLQISFLLMHIQTCKMLHQVWPQKTSVLTCLATDWDLWILLSILNKSQFWWYGKEQLGHYHIMEERKSDGFKHDLNFYMLGLLCCNTARRRFEFVEYFSWDEKKKSISMCNSLIWRMRVWWPAISKHKQDFFLYSVFWIMVHEIKRAGLRQKK